MTRFRLALLAALSPMALAPTACSTGPEPLLPPLARVEVPVIEHRDLPQPRTEPRPAPTTLLGATRPAVSDYLGVPDLKRREPPAEIWRYGNESCGVHLFFYDADGVMTVHHVETRLDDESGLDEATCLDRLRRRATAG